MDKFSLSIEFNANNGVYCISTDNKELVKRVVQQAFFAEGAEQKAVEEETPPAKTEKATTPEEKGLVKREIIDKNGFKKTLWVNPKNYAAEKKSDNPEKKTLDTPAIKAE